MKILFLSDVPFANPVSGSEQMLNQQATRLAKEGLNVFAITRNSHPSPGGIKFINGVVEGAYYACPQNTCEFLFKLIKYPPRFYRGFVRDCPFQVVICHQPLNYCALLNKKSIRQTPLIYNFHSPSHEEYLLLHKNRSSLINFFPAKVRQVIETICLKRARTVMVESRYMKKKVELIHRIPGHKIIVNPGGVDLERFKPAPKRDKLKAQFNLPKSKTHLLTVRNLEPRMGLDNLLKGMAHLKKQKIEVHLTLGGEGIERKNLEQLIAELKLDKDVNLTGFIPPDLLPKYYAAADFFILPTRYLEGFGLVTPESMACGTPVLGTPVGATEEILLPFDPDLLFKNASPEAMATGIRLAVQRYVNNIKAYNTLRGQCQEFAQNHYSWERHMDQLTSIIRSAVLTSSEAFV
ncbi:MAG: glycosyltransferase family 4 protein [Planctomycetota bacterium]|jgi:glycosyltransferase involved in cell wall biosynthesis